MAITNRQEFGEYCLRRLGHPVQQINVDDDQVDDRIDDALAFYQDYHYDGVEKVILKHVITANNVIDGYIVFPDLVQGINRIISGFGIQASNWMSPMYQLTIDAAFSLTGGSTMSYNMTMMNLAELSFMFDSTPGVNFNRHRNQLIINDSDALVEGSYILVEATRYLDPEDFEDVWKDRWLKRYATALIKKQWGENIKTFAGIQLLGGVTLDGQNIWQEADAEIALLEQEIIHSYGSTVDDRIA